MPYDICEDEATLDYIENEMARRGVTQQLIDETRAHTETRMLADLQRAAAEGASLEMHDAQGATPVTRGFEQVEVKSGRFGGKVSARWRFGCESCQPNSEVWSFVFYF